MSSPTLYQQIRRTLTDEIMSGQYAAGDRFPPENVLCDRFGVSRQTVREAIRELQSRGLLKRRRGAGTIVCGRHDPTLFVQEIDTLGRLFDAAQDTRLERKIRGLIVVREGLATLLGCPPGESWLRVAGRALACRAQHQAVLDRDFRRAQIRRCAQARDATRPPRIFTLLERHFGVTLHAARTGNQRGRDRREACRRTGRPTPAVRACSCCAAISIRPTNCIRSRSASIRPTASP